MDLIERVTFLEQRYKAVIQEYGQRIKRINALSCSQSLKQQIIGITHRSKVAEVKLYAKIISAAKKKIMPSKNSVPNHSFQQSGRTAARR